ncbi:MAG: AAA family ATPase [Bacteroidetes bacterium]|nr:AAA family ATPase [Bacteroidota bacterium]
MSIDKLKKLADKYSLSEEIVEQRENDRLSLVEKFPLAKLKDLSIDQFVQGTDDNSFCYWLEFKKIGFGIGGGNASKFGIYKTKNKEEIVYATGYGKNKTYLDDQSAKDYFADLLNKILKALDYTREDQIDKIRELEIPMWNMVLQKILGIYYPEKFLTIGSPTVLIKCAKELGIQNIEHSSDNSILINYECKKAISKNPQFSKWSYEKIGTFIWETFDGENKKRKRTESKQYWLYAPGENAYLWDEFYEGGILGLGWDEIGDLSQYKSRDEIKKALVDAYGGTGSKKNDVSANDDFLNKIKIGDVIIAKKGRGELLGYGVVTSDYIFDKNRKNYQKTRQIDWKIKGNWNVDFSLVLKTLTDITKYSSEDTEYDTYYEKLLGIMGVGQTQKDNRESFTIWLTKKYGEDSGTTSSYIKAIDILSQILSKELFRTTDDSYLDSLYKDLIKEQRNPEGKYYHSDAPSYGSNGFYSASIKSYREFLKRNQANQTLNNNPMEFPLNTILYGPPGTGKTHNTILRAAQIIENRVINSYDEALEVFKANLHDKIEFITFHQNYSYEDFIQGLRPETKDENEQLKFKKSDGAFKVIADRALSNIKESEKAPEELSQVNAFSEALEILKDKILESDEPIKINETAYFTAVEDDAFRYSGDNWTLNDKGFNGFRMKYSDLVRFFEDRVKERREIKNLENISGLAKQHATYFIKAFELVKSLMPKSINKTLRTDKKNYVIIIDEINRANISRVFGELITLIEPDKRSHGSIPLEARLPSGDPFIVPSNLFIIGTMNTADKSIALLDIALRRRFEFESMYPKYEIEGQEIYDVEILEKINKQIIKSKGHDFQIGHAYFMGDNKDLIQRMNKKVIPLLLEYYMNDEKEVKGILNSAGLIIEENSWPLKISGKND